MNARVRREIDLSGIYIKYKVTSGKIPTRIPAESSNHWIRIASKNVGDRESQKFNEGVSRMLKRQERALGS